MEHPQEADETPEVIAPSRSRSGLERFERKTRESKRHLKGQKKIR